MRRPKDQTRRPAKADLAPMDDDFDPQAPRAENVLLPSERKKTEAVIKKSRAVKPTSKIPVIDPTTGTVSEVKILPSVSPDVAPTAEEPKAATPAPKKPKAQPAAKSKPQKQEPTWQPPEGAVTIFEKPEYTKPIGYIELKGQVYEAYTVTGQRLAIGLNEGKTEENFRQKYAAHKAR